LHSIAFCAFRALFPDQFINYQIKGLTSICILSQPNISPVSAFKSTKSQQKQPKKTTIFGGTHSGAHKYEYLKWIAFDEKFVINNKNHDSSELFRFQVKILINKKK
jgi:hypothetical protein